MIRDKRTRDGYHARTIVGRQDRVLFMIIAHGGFQFDDDPRVDRDAVWAYLSEQAYWGRWRTSARTCVSRPHATSATSKRARTCVSRPRATSAANPEEAEALSR